MRITTVFHHLDAQISAGAVSQKQTHYMGRIRPDEDRATCGLSGDGDRYDDVLTDTGIRLSYFHRL